MLQRCIRQFKPAAVILDPISGLVSSGTESAASAMMVRMLDFMKSRGVTSVLTSLIGSDPSRDLDIGVRRSWTRGSCFRITELDRGRTHWLSVLKSRGMPHSTQSETYRITPHGIDLRGAAATPMSLRGA